MQKNKYKRLGNQERESISRGLAQKKSIREIAKEIEYVHNLLDIQQLRHDYKLNFQFNIAPDTLNIQVMPLLLIPLVENALKHGDLSDALLPLKVSVLVKQNKLEVEVINKIAAQQSPIKGGVGLKNLQRRLELTYRSDEYSFTTEQKENIFSVKITIPLS